VEVEMLLVKAMLFRIEYEIIPNMNAWTAHIIAKSAEEATNYIQKFVRRDIRVTSCGMVAAVDAITPSVMPKLGTPVAKPPGLPPVVPKEEKKEEINPPAPKVKQSIIKK
jgi:hypothetical protein